MGVKIAVLGGGASGLAAAIAAARAGAEVAVVEHNCRLGKKILSTGNGKCNFTNKVQDISCYRGRNPGFMKEALGLFGLEETLAFFESLGIVPREKNGYYYPAGGQAGTVAQLLALEAGNLGVEFFLNVNIRLIQERPEGGFLLEGQRKKPGAGSGREKHGAGPEKKRRVDWIPFSLVTDRLILACGGKAAPSSGSDGSGYGFAESFGHHIIPVYPALVQLKCKENFYPQLAGVRTEACVQLWIDGKESASDIGELQLASYGISGIPVFQVSRFAVEALGEGKAVKAVIDLMPSMSLEALVQYFMSYEKERYTGLFNDKLLAVLLKRYGHEPEKLALGLKTFETEVVGFHSFDHAQVTAGGVDTTEVDGATMESRLVRGLYFAGELLDVDGICGGYNLQWAWTSGYLAGRSAAAPRRCLA